jgi:endonuclease-3
MRALQNHKLAVENVYATEALVLNGLINKVGFHNNNTKYLKQVAEILINEDDCDIPLTTEEMIKSISDVEPKMAFIIENVAFGKYTGIGVDTHMHRIDLLSPMFTIFRRRKTLPESDVARSQIIAKTTEGG